jgi:hypothetical protein
MHTNKLPIPRGTHTNKLPIPRGTHTNKLPIPRGTHTNKLPILLCTLNEYLQFLNRLYDITWFGAVYA